MNANLDWILIRRVVSKAALTVVVGFNVVAYQNCGQFEPVPLELESTGQRLADITPIVYTAPAINLTNSPSVLSNHRDQTARFEVAVDSRLQLKSAVCTLDFLPPADCSALAFPMTGLSDGDHVLVIAAEDSNGQKASEVRHLFRVDATAPVVALSQMPPAISGASVTIAFTANDALSGVNSIECALDGASFTKCTTPMNLTMLVSGNHSLKIRASDTAGNMSPEMTSTWMVDSSAPAMTLSMKPEAVTNSKSATFAFSATIGTTAVSAFQCSLDNYSFTACTSPVSYMNLADGAHSFRVQGRDNNNQYSTPLAYSWTIDTIVPTTPLLTANVGANVKVNSASISFSSTDAGSSVGSYQCSLDNAPFTVCASPRSLTTLAEGLHSLRVKSFDTAGNESMIGSYSWRVDMTLPVIAITAKPLATTQETSATFQFTVTDAGSGVSTTECQLDMQAYAACTSPRALTNLAAGLHAFRVRATDNAGNVQVLEDKWTVESTTAPPPLDGRLLYANNCSIVMVLWTRRRSTVVRPLRFKARSRRFRRCRLSAG
ncbi:MAG: hypothetical protein AAB250_13755 [Bdellovibrionota bacterium]